jgi:hypothetical protein
MKNTLIKLNNWAALKLMALYGAAITIWLFALYSLLGAVVSSSTQNHMLYWSNAAQLVFCPLSIYVGSKLLKSHKDTNDKITEIHKHITQNKN